MSTSQVRGRDAEPPALVVQPASGVVPVPCLASGWRCHHRYRAAVTVPSAEKR
ncbi:hypothetical protein ACFQGX_35030 [Nonomuraea dietziae]|uniref:hypothetical protein n=1 Tax=Nonomuraea dietziae TaxID=65515 RepID=UPI0036063452